MSSTSAQRAPSLAVYRLKVISEVDPGAIVRVLQPFQALNVVPYRVRVDRMGGAYLELGIDVDATELAPDAVELIAAKLREHPAIMAAASCD